MSPRHSLHYVLFSAEGYVDTLAFVLEKNKRTKAPDGSPQSCLKFLIYMCIRETDYEPWWYIFKIIFI